MRFGQIYSKRDLQALGIVWRLFVKRTRKKKKKKTKLRYERVEALRLAPLDLREGHNSDPQKPDRQKRGWYWFENTQQRRPMEL